MKKSVHMLTGIVLGIGLLAGWADAAGHRIDPAELSATANTTGAGSATAVVDGDGLDDVDNPTTHTDAGGDGAAHWRSGDYAHGGGVEADEWFVIDLGGTRDLVEMRVWSSFQDRSQTRSPTRRNLTRFGLYYANTGGSPGNPLDNPGNWTLLLNDQAVPDPDTNNIEVGGDNNDLISILDAGVYDLTGVTATHLALFDMQNGGVDGWSGHHTAIAEIEVFADYSSVVRVHYRADNVDGAGNPGDAGTTTLVNLANPGTHDGTIVSGSGVTYNGGQSDAPYKYGVVLNDSIQTYIQANSYQIGGGVNKVTAATWEFWLRADSGITAGRGALYGEFPAGTVNQTRHFLRLEGIGTGTRTALYDEFPPSNNSAGSDSQLFDTSEFAQIVVTKDGDTMTFYKDGEQVGTAKTHSETFSGSVAQTAFGFRNSQNESFDGQFNIIRVYETALTPEDVLASYHAEIPPTQGTLFIVK